MTRVTKALAILACLGPGACVDDGGNATAGGTAPATSIRATVIASGQSAAGEAPRIVLVADGREVGAATVTASRAEGQWGSYVFDWQGARPSVLAVRYANDAGERDLWVRKVVLDGAELRVETATYVRDGREALPGRARMSWAGELRFHL